MPSQLSAMAAVGSARAAKHAFAEAHETAAQPAPPLLGWRVHVVPFQFSVCPCRPTAVQAAVDGQDTALRSLVAAVGTAVHVVPFHVSTRPAPTAVQAFSDGQDTLLSPPAPGVGWIVQVAPFHRSARRKDRMSGLFSGPTAV